jgi:HD-like signal output (HDOD) protein
MKKILFVDDEPAVLDGLQDSLRKHRRRWDMTFACGGEAAISELSKKDYDVVVSDVRMPGVNGVEVLQFAKDKYPQAIRIALTGFADEKSTLKLTTLAQRYLTKPCAIDDLDEAITRDSGLIDAFDNPVVQALAGSAGRLPASANTQQVLLDRLNSTDGSIEDIAIVIEEDMALTAKILQLANSSFFRRQASVVSARHAVSYLGVDVIRSLVLAEQLFERSQSIPKMDYFDIDALRKHSLLTSTIAREISPTSEIASVAMTAGLLHDVGKIIIALEKPELIASLVNVESGAPYEWVDAQTERSIVGCTHAEVGGYFLNLWGVPSSVVEAVTFHDDPAAIVTREFDALGVVHVSNYLAHWGASEQVSEAIENKLDRDYLASVQMAGNEELWKSYTVDIVCEPDE